MPMHADLLQPISSEAPAGVDLAYDKLYDQIKEARLEDDDTLPTGSWTRAPKKADRPLVIRLAGEALATRSKDLRLAGWYFESLLRQEGFTQLTPILDALEKLQEEFWGSLYPFPEEDGDLGRRAGALESIAVQLSAQLRLLALTRNGVDFLQAQAARTLGYEADATTKEKKELREDAVKRGRVLLEELDKAVADTPKAFYEETEAALGSATLALVALDAFHEERYGEDPPSLIRLKTAIEDLHKFVTGVLAEKRKLEPDVGAETKSNDTSVTPADPFARFDAQGSGGGTSSPTETVAATADEPRAEPTPGAAVATSSSAAAPAQSAAEPGSWEAALAQVAGAVRFLARGGLSPETAYTLAAAPGVALLFRAGHDHPWPAPAAGVRQNLRKLARERKWAALEEAGLQALAESPATIWLDLHRYLWQAAAELGHHALAAAVLATVRGFLEQLPDLDKALLDDDTPSASMETQSWLRALHPELNGGAEGVRGKASAATLASFVHASTARNGKGSAEMDAFTQALGLLKQGRSAEAIHHLSRDAEQQPSGRLRFERRLQTAELCLQAGHAAVAQPLLADLTAELERRTLEGWESSSLLGKPLALMIRCLDLGTTSSDNRAALFARLCRLDPVAAAALNRPPSGGAS